MKRKLFLTVCMTTCLATAVLSGCNSGGDTAKIEHKDFGSYPISTDQTLSYWMPMNPNISTKYANMGETPFGKELEKRTGIKVEYIHPVSGQEEQSLSLLIASDELPDIVEYGWSNYMSGPSKSISEGTIRSLNELMKEYAPNLTKYLEENKDVDKMIKTDEGDYYVFPFIRGDKMLSRSQGLMLREDWLKELNLEVPETVDELENVLKTFKEKKNLSSAFTFRPNNTSDALNLFGATNGFYVQDGKVKFGPLDENYKNALMKLHDWYESGILDNNFLSVDQKILDASVLNDRVGAVLAGGGGDLGKWYDTTEKSGKSFQLVGVPDLKDKKGGSYLYHSIMPYYPGNNSCAISGRSKNPELAAKFLDYAYSEEGHMLYNFGVEGDTYTMNNGTPEYTEKITNNQDGLTMTQAMAENFRSSWSGPFVQDKNYILGYYYRPAQRESLDNWIKSYDTVASMQFPNVSYTNDESSDYTNIMLDINKYVDEKRAEFIIGTHSFDEWDSFISEINRLNIDKAIQINQSALERYNKR